MTTDEEKQECKLCERVWAAFGMALGLAFVYISVDLLTGGRLTGLWSGRVSIEDGEDSDDA